MHNIAVWGIGEHAQRNTIPAIIQSKHLSLAGFLSRDSTKAHQYANKHDVNYWKTPQQMLNDKKVDVVYIASPIALHHEHVLLALHHGKHVICEKSLATNYEECENLCLTAKKAGLMLAECFMYLYHPQFLQLKELLEQEAIGQLRNIVARFGYPHLDSSNIRYKAELGGGALLDAGVYPLSAILGLAGLEPTHSFGIKQAEGNYSVDTLGSASLWFESGLCGQAFWGMGLDYRNELELWGSTGIIKINRAFSKPPELATNISLSKNGSEQIIETGAGNHFTTMFDFFASQMNNATTHKELRHFSIAVARQAAAIRNAPISTKNGAP